MKVKNYFCFIKFYFIPQKTQKRYFKLRNYNNIKLIISCDFLYDRRNIPYSFSKFLYDIIFSTFSFFII